jgi:hypothetical protein
VQDSAVVAERRQVGEKTQQLLRLPEPQFVERWPRIKPATLPNPVREACISRYVAYLERTYRSLEVEHAPEYDDYIPPLTSSQRIHVLHALAVLAAIADQFPKPERDSLEAHLASVRAWIR